MQSDVKLSTRFLTARNAHQVRMLVDIRGESPPRRPPINVAMVLDRSGSMRGQPLEEARKAAMQFARFLGRDDRLSVVIFDDEVATIYGPSTPEADEVVHRIGQIHAGGTTNLSGGWLKGRAHVESGLVDGTNRVVLFTDGRANQGITDLDQLTDLAAGARTQGAVSTSCIGFGRNFNENLLQAMSRAGMGNFWYVEGPDQMTAMFEEEIEGLVTLAAQNLEVEVALTHPEVAGVSFVQSYPLRRTDDHAWTVSLGDLYGTSARALGLIFHVENVADLGDVELGQVSVRGDVLVEEGIEHRVLTMPVRASLDGADHVEPEVERTLIRFESARRREEAIERADDGDYEGAAHLLREASNLLQPYTGDPAVDEEREDLDAEAARMEQGRYEAEDRKYHMARGTAAMEMKTAYAAKLSRRRPRRTKKNRS